MGATNASPCSGRQADRRAHARLKPLSSMVGMVCRRRIERDPHFLGEFDSGVLFVEIEDIFMGGVKIKSSRLIEASKTLDFIIFNPASGEWKSLRAALAWIRPHHVSGGHTAGLRFLNPPEAQAA